MPGRATDTCPLPCNDDALPTDRLPVTILSGFLGSGKTTLLEWILKSKDHGLRCAVIVNDIGELNIDAALLGSHKLKQTAETIVQFENGRSLAEAKSFDYLIIESSGVSEPQQVAESFAPEFAEMHVQAAQEMRAEAERVKTEARARKDGGDEEAIPVEVDEGATLRLEQILSSGGLSRIARLDTDRQDPDTVDDKDERNISDLMCDQLEFADVIIINKSDVVDEATLEQVKGVVRSLNPEADILTSVRSRIDLNRVLDTTKFSFEKSVLSAGWLQSLREGHKPETEEYGIGTFVYRARRPFSPLRLWEMVRNRLVVIQDSYEEALCKINVLQDDSDDEMEVNAEDSGSEDEAFDLQPQLDAVGRLKAKMADAAFAPLLRSKGFFWLATRPMLSGEWYKAGVMLTVGGGWRWLCETNQEEWPSDDDVRAKMLADFEGKWGDRRQELVFIGQTIKTIQPLLTAELDACLLNDTEFAQWQKIMNTKKSMKSKTKKLEALFDDGWEDWIDEEDPDLMQMLGGHEGHDHA